MPKKKQKKTQPEASLYDIIARALCSAAEPVRMKELAAACGLTNEGESVPSSVSAKIRLRVNKMVEDGLVRKTGDKSTSRYEALAKLKKQFA